ncbi:hypothetical protein [Flavobacterium flavigenum]|uniref:hypothetical protein n=1 Tax=Flavobacterium flavigenum TaxID=3003258 RepID=UPI0022ABE1FD|nr:hypothetical protein [Flavobacterium flavigenum]
MMKIVIKIIGNGLFYGIAIFILCFCIGYFNGNMPLKNILGISTPIALFALIINGVMYTRFTKSIKILERITIKIEDFESFIIEAPANHLIGGDIVSGKLCLTDKRLIFKTHQGQEFIWEKSELHTMVFYPSLKNKGGEFTVENEAGRKLMFEVDHLKLWKNILLGN